MPTNSGHTKAIRAKTIIGTAVKDSDGDRVGTVEDVILDKTTNNIMFAVLGFGGVMGMGEKFHPVPWSVLSFDESDNSYVVGFNKRQLQSAPADTIDALTRNDGMNYRDATYDYYGASRYWS